MLPPVGAAALALACAEFVRSGFYGAYLTQVVDTQFGLPVTAAAGAWTAHFVADTLMRGPAGALVLRLGLRPAMVGGALLSAGALALLLLPISVWVLIAAAVLHGLGFAALWPGTLSLVTEAAREGYQGRALTLVTTSVMGLSGLGFFVFGALAARGDSFALGLAQGLLLLSLVLTLAVPRRLALATPAGAEAASAARPRSFVAGLLPLLPAAFMQTLTLTLLGPWLFRIAPQMGLSYWGLVGLLVVGGGVAYGLMPLTGRFADRGRARTGVMLGYALVSAGFVGFALTPAPWLLYGLALVAGLGYAFLTPGWAALVSQVLPPAQRPAAWGILMTAENAGLTLGPLVGALALKQAGVPGPFMVGAVLAALTASGYVVFRRAFHAAST
ncbi:MFS transporter [Deinococcus sp. HMF7620]|uniref:MFS transporter n=2 Tax=Deinococcaceae TaxID=183710 RepID=A0A7C9M870_9DEIO|nr:MULTISPECIES: MFS transporter [Deinococcus]MVN86679.1 MFS transporter [Deinococcus arboris]